MVFPSALAEGCPKGGVVGRITMGISISGHNYNAEACLVVILL